MYWLFDHANLVYIVLGIVALAFAIGWWVNQRAKYLAYAGGVVLLIVLYWLASRIVVTDQQQIHNSIDDMADAVMAQDADRLFKHVAAKFAYKGMDRKQMYDAVSRAIKMHKVQTVFISSYRAEEISRAAGKAHVSFLVRVDDVGGGTVFFARCEADFVLEGDQWKARGIEFFNPAANQDQPLALPLP